MLTNLANTFAGFSLVPWLYADATGLWYSMFVLPIHRNLYQESSAVAREDVLQPIQFLSKYWPLRSS